MPIEQPQAFAEASLPCRSDDAELFFADSPDQLEQAKVLCRGCPVRELCLAGALRRREPWGVWGGELFFEGVVIPRKRGRGRPRKHQPGSKHQTGSKHPTGTEAA